MCTFLERNFVELNSYIIYNHVKHESFYIIKGLKGQCHKILKIFEGLQC